MKNFVHLLWFFISFLFLSGCENDRDHTKGHNNAKEGFDISSYKCIFETDAPDLVPVDFQQAGLDEVRKVKKSLLNVIPEWEKYEVMTIGDINFIEIPLSGDVYNAGTWTTQQKKENSKDDFVMETKMLWNRSFMIIREDTKKDSLTYYIVDMAMENKDLSGLHFLGNDKIGDGFVIFSDLEGRCTASYRVEGGRRYAITISPGIQSGDGREFNSISLNHIPNLSRKLTKSYSSDENGEGGFGTSSKGWAFCSLCGAYVWGNGNCGCQGVIIDGNGGGSNPDDWWLPGGGGTGGVGGWEDTGGNGGSGGGGVGGPGGGSGGSGGGNNNNDKEPTVTISISTALVTLGNNYSVNVQTNNGSYVFSYVNVKIRDVNGVGGVIGNNAGENIVRAYVPGRYEIYAEAKFYKASDPNTRKTISSNASRIEIQAPDQATILAATQSTMDTYWAETKNANSPGYYTERSAVIFFNTENNTYYFERQNLNGSYNVCYAATVLCHFSVTTNYYGPHHAQSYPVAIFHTHTPRICPELPLSNDRDVGPSGVDLTNHGGYVAFVYDYIGETKKLSPNHGINDPAQVYHYHLERAAYPDGSF